MAMGVTTVALNFLPYNLCQNLKTQDILPYFMQHSLEKNNQSILRWENTSYLSNFSKYNCKVEKVDYVAEPSKPSEQIWKYFWKQNIKIKYIVKILLI